MWLDVEAFRFAGFQRSGEPLLVGTGRFVAGSLQSAHLCHEPDFRLGFAVFSFDIDGFPTLVLCEVERGRVIAVGVVEDDFVFAHVNFGVVFLVFKNKFAAEVMPFFDAFVLAALVEVVEAVEVFHLQRS